MPVITAIVLFFSFFPSAFADQRLRIESCQDCAYALRWDPQGDSLAHSPEPGWIPWMPEGSFGWLLPDSARLREFFDCPPAFLDGTDFRRHLLLAVVRHDPVEWTFSAPSAQFDPATGRLSLAYEARTRTLRPGPRKVSATIFRIELTPAMRRLGPENLLISLKETQTGPWETGQTPYPIPPGLLMFPPAFTPKDLAATLSQRQRLLASLNATTLREARQIPDWLLLEGAHLRKPGELPAFSCFLVQDSAHWDRLFYPLWGRRLQERVLFTRQDFDRMIALVVYQRKGADARPGGMTWADSGLELSIETKESEESDQPTVLVVLLPRQDLGQLTVRVGERVVRLEPLP